MWPRFQSTHPRGVRRREDEVSGVCNHFNPRTHVGCDHLSCCAWKATDEFQSTHPRGVRHNGFVILNVIREISIHAPTWGATDQRLKLFPMRNISIHAPTWGATEEIITAVVGQDISIHAPTWGATTVPGSSSVRSRFQSTHPRGVRHLSFLLSVVATEFQSTHPRGVRRISVLNLFT